MRGVVSLAVLNWRAKVEHLKGLMGEKEDGDMIERDRIFEDVRGAGTMVATDMMATETDRIGSRSYDLDPDPDPTIPFTILQIYDLLAIRLGTFIYVRFKFVEKLKVKSFVPMDRIGSRSYDLDPDPTIPFTILQIYDLLAIRLGF
ncbi:hypothetical protein LXL04_012615 [Taraxacum kok-saghyz]